MIQRLECVVVDLGGFHRHLARGLRGESAVTYWWVPAARHARRGLSEPDVQRPLDVDHDGVGEDRGARGLEVDAVRDAHLDDRPADPQELVVHAAGSGFVGVDVEDVVLARLLLLDVAYQLQVLAEPLGRPSAPRTQNIWRPSCLPDREELVDVPPVHRLQAAVPLEGGRVHEGPGRRWHP